MAAASNILYSGEYCQPGLLKEFLQFRFKVNYSATSGRRYRSKKCICIKIQRYNSLGQIVACINNPGKDLC